MDDRPTSIAKSVEGLQYAESPLDRVRALRDQFARAQQDNQQQKEQQTERPPAQGSQMVKEDAPALKPAPSGPMRQMPDRQAYATKLQKEKDIAAARIEAAKKALATIKARQGKPRDHDHQLDRER